jgi:hypothetical protein
MLEHNAYLQQYHMALAPFLGIQPPPVLSPRGNAEEEIALQALQHMKNVPPSSLAGNANAASGAVGTRTPQRTSATRGEGARAHARDAIRGRSNPGRPGTRRDARDTARVEDARPPRTRARVDDVVRSRQTRDSNRRTRRRARRKNPASIPFPRIFLFFPNRALRLTSSRRSSCRVPAAPSRGASDPSNPSSEVSDHAHVALAAFANRGSPSRAYVKRHEFWKHKKKAERLSGLALRSATTSPAESAHFGGVETPLTQETPIETGADNDDAFKRSAADVDSSDCNELDSKAPEPRDSAVARAAARRPPPSTRGFYDTSGGGEGAPPGAKDELAKEWAALTTWIRMNLHQPRTARRKVLFVGHHPTLNPVPDVDVAEVGEANDGAAGEAPASTTGSKRKARDRASGDGSDADARGGSNGSKNRRTCASVSLRGRKREEDDFVFVLNPDLEWSDVGHDTRVRMKTLVAETMDIFERKYKKRKVWEWERKVQKYRPPGTNKTFNVPLGNVVRGIQEAYFIFNPDERPEGGGGGG